MMNTGKLAGKTFFGSTRGITLKAAKDGANVEIAAKALHPHPKLLGTLPSVSKRSTNLNEWTPVRNMSTFVENRAFYTQMRKMSSGGASFEEIFTSINSKLNEDLVKNNQAVIQFNVISGDKEDSYFIDLKNGSGSAGKGAPKEKPDATFTLNSDNFNKMIEGKLKAPTAFMTGKMKISGDLQKAIKLDKVLTSLLGKQ